MIKIYRIDIPDGADWSPHRYADGSYRIAPRGAGNKSDVAIHVETLEEVADYVDRDYRIRMSVQGTAPSLIGADKLRVER